MKNNKEPDNSNAVLLGVFIFIMLTVILFSYYRPDKMIGKKSYKPPTEVIKKKLSDKSKSSNQNNKTALKSERPNSKKQSAQNTIKNKEKPQVNTSLLSARMGKSEETQEKDTEAMKNIFLYYHKPFLEKLGVSPGAVNKVMELYSSYDAEREIIHTSYDTDIPGNEALRGLKSEVKLSRTNYDNKIINILGKKNFDQYDLFDKSLPNRELVNHFNNTLYRDDKINEKTKEELIFSLYNSDNLLLSKYRELIHSVSDDQSSYDKIRAAQKKEYLNEAKNILNESQYSGFVEFLKEI